MAPEPARAARVHGRRESGERAGAPGRGRAAVGADRRVPAGDDADRLSDLAGARTRTHLRRLRGSLALVGRRSRRVLDVGRGLLRDPDARALGTGRGPGDDAGRSLVRGCHPQLRRGIARPDRARRSGAPLPVRTPTPPRGRARRADRPGRGRRRRAATPWSGQGRPGRGSHPEHPGGRRRPAGVCEHRGDLVVVLARLRDPEPRRSLRADRTDGAHRRRRLHLRRQALRSSGRHRRASGRAADRAPDGPDPVPRPGRGAGRRRPRCPGPTSSRDRPKR